MYTTHDVKVYGFGFGQPDTTVRLHRDTQAKLIEAVQKEVSDWRFKAIFATVPCVVPVLAVLICVVLWLLTGTSSYGGGAAFVAFFGLIPIKAALPLALVGYGNARNWRREYDNLQQLHS